MAPKAADSADAAHFQILFAALKHNKSTIEPAWDDVAAEIGISYGRNANTKFKDLIKKYGYKLEAGKMVTIDGSAPAAAATPKKPPKAKKAKTPASFFSSRKKRKLSVDDDGDFSKEKDTEVFLKEVEDASDEGEESGEGSEEA